MPNKHFCQGPDCHTRMTNDMPMENKGYAAGKKVMMRAKGGMRGGKMTTKGKARGGKV